jgi:hypothetical protein
MAATDRFVLFSPGQFGNRVRSTLIWYQLIVSGDRSSACRGGHWEEQRQLLRARTALEDALIRTH